MPLTISAEYEDEIRTADDCDPVYRDRLLMELDAEREAHRKTKEERGWFLAEKHSEAKRAEGLFSGICTLKAELQQTKDALEEAETLRQAMVASLNESGAFLKRVMDDHRQQLAQSREALSQAQQAAIEIAKAKSEQWIELLKSREVAEKLAEALQERHRASCPDCLERPDLGIYPGLCKSKEALALYAAHRPATVSSDLSGPENQQVKS